MKTVPLHGRIAAGRVALVDDADYALVMPYRWHVRENVRYGPRGIRQVDGPYALVNVWLGNGKYRTILMHKLITGWARTDHADHNGLNNQRSNLRDATYSQNGQNQRPQVGRSSQYKGVSWEPRAKSWRAYIGGTETKRYLGNFASEEDAARAYDAAARQAFGQFAYFNFPDESAAA